VSKSKPTKDMTPGRMGYAFDWERLDELEDRGSEAELVLQHYRDAFPKFNTQADPLGLLKVFDQGAQGSCFPAGTKVTMHDGQLKNIEDVRFGDGVLTHAGRSRQVVDTMQRLYTGDLYRFFVKGWGSIRMTADHVVRVWRNGGLFWVRADEVEPSDKFVVSPGIKEQPVKFIDVADYVSDLQCDGDKVATKFSPDWVQRYIPADDLTCYVLGLYVAEGSTDKTCAGLVNRATFTMHEDERKEHEQIKNFAERLGVHVTVQHRQGSKAVNIRLQGCVIGRLLETLCGKFCNKKQVPAFIVQGTEEQKLAFARGYFDGDGTHTRYESGKIAASGNRVRSLQIHAATASRVLSQQLSTLLVSIGMKPGRSLTKKRSHQRFSSYQTYLYSRDACRFVGDEYTAGFANPAGHSNYGHCDEGQIRTIRSIEREPVQDFPVYDITVDEDHSFVAQGLVVHNCQGNALAQVFSICYFLATGRHETFSRSAGYYLAQKKDGISGDKGSTLSGGQWVATQHGMCLESDWPYPQRYNPAMPPSANGKFNFKLQATKPLKDIDSVTQWIESGLPIQVGLTWNSTCDQEVVSNYSSRSGGGHSTVFWQRRASGNIVNINSWGTRWNGDGVHEWTIDSVKEALKARWTVFIGYAPDGMSFPTPKVIS
jgi:intein/homing endonuclease